MPTIGQTEVETWRLIVFDQSRMHVEVIGNGVGSTVALPKVEIARGRRIAEAVTKAVKDRWDMKTLFLLTPTQPGSNEAHYGLMESLSALARDTEYRSVPLHGLDASLFQNQQDFRALQQSMNELENGEIDPASPFTKQGWFGELRAWINDSLRPCGLQLADSFYQLNGGQSFSLIRFETTGPDVWFKAVGEPNLREFSITLELSRRFPTYLPRLIGQRPDWNGWLALSAGEKSLREAKDLNSWEAAVSTLANLQIESTHYTKELVEAGAHDLRTCRLGKFVPSFMEVVSRLMRQQTKVSPSPLSADEVELLGLRVQDGITLLEGLRIPDTLGHLDLNPENIVLDNDRCRFVDWAEAYIGHPFFSFEYLLSHRRRGGACSPETESALIAAYARPWTRVLSPKIIAEALAYIPLVAIFAYATGLRACQDGEMLDDQNVAGYIRALARRMTREAARLPDRRTPCLSS